jgi:amino acid transporter
MQADAAIAGQRGGQNGQVPELWADFHCLTIRQSQPNQGFPMSVPPQDADELRDDMRTLHRLGYAQELFRWMGGFQNYAISLSIICILAGGITSFPQGFCGVGGAAIGLGWPVVCLFSLAVALTMGQVASAFPTAGGLYHWASILGGRGWGWITAWFNLAGLITALAAINVGTFYFFCGAFDPGREVSIGWQLAGVACITLSQAAINHGGIRLTSRLTDFSGYWILGVALALTVACLAFSPSLVPARLITFSNFSGLPPDNPVWPRTESTAWLFILGFLLPAYTLTGFDASAHVAEETRGASRNVPRGIVRSVLVSSAAGWMMLSALVLAMPGLEEAAREGEQVFYWILRAVFPSVLASVFFGAIVVAQYLCGLATMTSASRMAFAFARDGGLPLSHILRRVDPQRRAPAPAIWAVAAASIMFTVYSPVYATSAAVCAILLYISYVLPTALGLCAYGRTWTEMGPWHLGRWYRPLAVVSVAGCVLLLVIGMQPPNEKAIWIVGGMAGALAAGWWCGVRERFIGPPSRRAEDAALVNDEQNLLSS